MMKIMIMMRVSEPYVPAFGRLPRGGALARLLPWSSRSSDEDSTGAPAAQRPQCLWWWLMGAARVPPQGGGWGAPHSWGRPPVALSPRPPHT